MTIWSNMRKIIILSTVFLNLCLMLAAQVPPGLGHKPAERYRRGQVQRGRFPACRHRTGRLQGRVAKCIAEFLPRPSERILRDRPI
jgi:hypothetical protein